LVIELDGEGHFWEPGIEKDRRKEDYLGSIGVRVLRFENKLLFENVNWVLEKIKAEFNHP
jgi:very-short-patch-repair endonuclease